MNRPIAQAWLGAIGFFWVSAAAPSWATPPTPRIHVFYGKLTGSFEAKTREFLRSDFEPKLLKLGATHTTDVVLHPQAEIPELIHALSDPQTLGIFWVGHPGLVAERGRLLNSFLQTASGVFVPKDVAQAAHPHLRFFGLVSCHFSDLLKRYSAASTRFSWFVPEAQELDKVEDQDDVLTEVSSIFLAPVSVFSQVEPHLGSWRQDFATHWSVATLPQRQVTIDYRDLLSSKFTYGIYWNQRLVGVLQKVGRAGGRVQVSIPNENGTLRIRPDDPKRARKVNDPENLVDDILIDQISVDGPLLKEPIHLGDDAFDWDAGTKTKYASSDEDFRKYPPSLEWFQTIPPSH